MFCLRIHISYYHYAGILEWIIAFGFVFYLLTFYFDLRMSKGMHKGDLSREKLTTMQHDGANGGRAD
jgi:hypothetical protein